MQARKSLLRPVLVLSYVVVWGAIEMIALWRSRRMLKLEQNV